MANKYKNEMEIKLGQETILLRPTFENISDMESNVGGLTYLAWKFSRGLALGGTQEAIKLMPSITELAQIIYYNQAARKEDDLTLRKYSLEDIWVLVQEEGIKLTKPVTEYLSVITAGNKNAAQLPESEKKS